MSLRINCTSAAPSDAANLGEGQQLEAIDEVRHVAADKVVDTLFSVRAVPQHFAKRTLDGGHVLVPMHMLQAELKDAQEKRAVGHFALPR